MAGLRSKTGLHETRRAEESGSRSRLGLSGHMALYGRLRRGTRPAALSTHAVRRVASVRSSHRPPSGLPQALVRVLVALEHAEAKLRDTQALLARLMQVHPPMDGTSRDLLHLSARMETLCTQIAAAKDLVAQAQSRISVEPPVALDRGAVYG
jgi:hypothetical protein